MRYLICFILCIQFFAEAKKKVTSAEVKQRIKNIDSKSKKAPQDYFDLARNYLLIKDYESAIKHARQGNTPQSVEGLELIAKISHEKQDHLEEVRALEIIKTMGKQPPGFFVRLGNAYSEINKTDEVIKNFRQALADAPKYEKAYEALYQFYLSKKNTYDARLILLEIIEKFGEKPKWLNEMCKMEIREKYFDSAKNVCQSALVTSPNVAENHVNLALAFKFTEAEDQARKILYAAAKQFKDSESTQREAGVLSQLAKNYELSETHFGQCGKINSKAGDCFLELAKAQFQLKKYEPALQSFLKACPHIKEAELEMRRHAYDLDKQGQPKLYKKYMDQTEKCQSLWFSEAKKTQK